MYIIGRSRWQARIRLRMCTHRKRNFRVATAPLLPHVPRSNSLLSPIRFLLRRFQNLSASADHFATLKSFAAWRKTLPPSDRFGLWQLLTACYEEGVQGFSFIAVRERQDPAHVWQSKTKKLLRATPESKAFVASARKGARSGCHLLRLKKLLLRRQRRHYLWAPLVTLTASVKI